MSELPITVADIIVLGILLISAVVAFVRGFVHEVLSIAAWVGAALVTLYAFPVVQPYARDLIAIDLLADIGAGIVLFVASLVILAVLVRLLAARVQNSALGALDRSLGLVFGVVRGAVIVAAAWLVLVWALPEPQDHPAWIREAKSRRLVEAGAAMLAGVLPPSMQLEAAPKGALGSAVPAPDYDRLSQPAPKADAPDDKKGYTDGERRRLDQAIETLTGGSGNQE